MRSEEQETDQAPALGQESAREGVDEGTLVVGRKLDKGWSAQDLQRLAAGVTLPPDPEDGLDSTE